VVVAVVAPGRLLSLLVLVLPVASSGCFDCSGNPFDNEACTSYTGVYAWAAASGWTNETALRAAFGDLGIPVESLGEGYLKARDPTHEVELAFDGHAGGNGTYKLFRVSIWFTTTDPVDLPEGQAQTRAERDWPAVQPDYQRIVDRLASAGVAAGEPTIQGAIVVP
jgi:hypothetical protein